MSCLGRTALKNERGFELGKHSLPDGRTFTVKASPVRYAELYELHYQGQMTLFRPADFELAKREYDLHEPLRLGVEDGQGQAEGGPDKGRGVSPKTVPGHGGEDDNRGR